MTHLFRELSQRYGWTPTEIGELTIPQMMMYFEKSGGTVRLGPVGSIAEAVAAAKSYKRN